MAKVKSPAQKKANEEIAARLIKKFEEMRGKRGNWETTWQEVSERVWPSQSKLFQGQRQGSTQGERRGQSVYDATSSIALNRFTAILDSLLTPMSATWHTLKPSDPYLLKDRETVLWFEETNRILFKYRYAPRSNFIAQNQLVYKMLGAYGSGSIFVDELKSRQRDTGLRYRNIHLSEMYFDENHQGIVDCATRHFPMTARQILQKWDDALPEELKKKCLDKPDKEYFLIHSVEPRGDYDAERKDYKGMEYASYYVLLDGKILLSEGGYRTFPYPTARYEQVPGEVYGRSPAMDTMPAIKTLEEMKKTVLTHGHRTVAPVLLAHDDGVLDTFSLKPGALNMGGVSAEGRALVQALPVGNIAVGKDLMDDERAGINDAFLVSLFQILAENPRMTATEVMERLKEKNILLAPTIGRQYAEYHGPMIERELDLLSQLKKADGQPLLPPFPPALVEAGGEYRIEYESPMARSQRAEEAAGLMRVVETGLNIAQQSQNTAPLDHFNWDQIIPDIAEIHGLPAKWLNSKDEIDKMRESRAKQMEQADAVTAAPGAAALINADAKAQQAQQAN